MEEVGRATEQMSGVSIFVTYWYKKKNKKEKKITTGFSSMTLHGVPPRAPVLLIAGSVKENSGSEDVAIMAIFPMVIDFAPNVPQIEVPHGIIDPSKLRRPQ